MFLLWVFFLFSVCGLDRPKLMVIQACCMRTEIIFSVGVCFKLNKLLSQID